MNGILWALCWKLNSHAHGGAQHLSGYDLYFAMARGVPGTEALDMSKFFDTNYHYLVPELASTVSPKPDFSLLYDKVCMDTCPLHFPVAVMWSGQFYHCHEPFDRITSEQSLKLINQGTSCRRAALAWLDTSWRSALAFFCMSFTTPEQFLPLLCVSSSSAV